MFVGTKATAFFLSLSCLGGICQGAPCIDSVAFDLPVSSDGAVITVKGYKPTIKRVVGRGMGNHVVVKNFVDTPNVAFTGSSTINISAGDVCAGTPTASPTAAPATASTAFALSALSYLSGGSSLGTVTSLLFGLFMSVSAQETCSDVEIEIHQDYLDLINYDFKSGQYNECPPETVYWKHHPLAFGGYEGCVSEKYLFPCPQDNEGMRSASLYAKYPYNWDSATNSCIPTGYTFENRTFWTVSGDPLDKYELVKRTGLNPTVTFPFLAGPYPAYTNGPSELETDDTVSAKKAAYDLQVYLGAFKEEHRDDWYISWTEGAESGMVITFAAMALDMARTTCNRDLYVFNEVPSYGYSTSDAAAFANRYSSSFYDGPECLCAADSSCKSPTIRISFVGWLPGTPIPTRTGGDGIEYPADSSSAASPWFESIVFPENPSGALKIPRLPNSNRRVCDGVYLWPMYFGTKGNVIPIDDVPDCATWAFAITKAYSASVRAGYVMYKKEYPTVASAVATIIGSLGSLTYGSLSQWTWLGQVQLWDMIMSREVDDPTSWVGAYTGLMNEKWDAIVDAFDGCPVIELTNPYASAYAWFKMKEPYVGVQPASSTPTFFLQVLGVQASTHSHVFRGANPADYYGPGYGNYDFVRMQMYRDLSVYKEIARRAKIVCSDPNASIGDFISVNTWHSVARKGMRRLNKKTGLRHTVKSRRAELMREHPELTEAQAQRLAETTEVTLALDEAMEMNCAPEYTSSCIMAQWNHHAGGRDY